MKKLILILAVLLLLGGGGFAGWWFFFKPPAETEEVVEAPAIPSIFVEFPRMSLALIKEGVVTHHLIVTVTVEVAQGDDEIWVKRWRPKLHDSFYAELHSLFAYRYFTEGGYDNERVRKRLLMVAEKVVGPDIIRGIEISIDSITKPSNT